MNDRTTALGRRLVPAARAVLWAQAALLVCAGAAMVAFGEAATGAEARVGTAMMVLAVYPFALSAAAVALAAAFRERRPGLRGWTAGYEVFLLLVTGPFVNYPSPAVATLGLVSILTTTFVIATMASPFAAPHFPGRPANALPPAEDHLKAAG
ncbi:hypothetical protein [Actinomadura opuntiae]|uniref:hypothetical protein n=1 Tax=Actinomadura sp. OS1-43 TaxID=604315 RepID=UPI00255ACC0C|nr:hypothetical protein [Actinomadura sp. OS1-43]MDL4813620.1 hypothetical protein [Actinomadura sp. OS1-43]